MIASTSRRLAFGRIGGTLAFVATAAGVAEPSLAAQAGSSAAGALSRLAQQLKLAPRRRQFKSVPFMVTRSEDWDEQAARLLLGYADRSKQVWENTDLGAAWPNLMREALNGEVFAHSNPEFLQVGAMHGLAHLALFSDDAWTHYRLSELAGPTFASNTLIREKLGASTADDLQDVAGFYGPDNDNIVSLQKRGAVFVACHDSIYAIARKLQQVAGADTELAKTPTGEIAADLTNRLVPDCVLVPSVVAFLVELQKAGFTYVKGS